MLQLVLSAVNLLFRYLNTVDCLQMYMYIVNYIQGLYKLMYKTHVDPFCLHVEGIFYHKKNKPPYQCSTNTLTHEEKNSYIVKHR